MVYALLGVGLLCLLAALWLALRARRTWRSSGLPPGQLVYADTGAWQALAKPYFSTRYQLTGKPDYLVDTGEGLAPVEVKNTAARPGGHAYDSHVLQLAAYCLLVEEAHAQRPPYGLVHYTNATVRIDYTDALRQDLLATMDALRASRHAGDVERSHDDPARCRGCGVRHACGPAALS